MGGRTRDLINDELEFVDAGQDPATVGGVRHNTGRLKGKDNAGVFDLRFSHPDHEAVDSLVHELAETSDTEIVYGDDGPTSITTYTDGGHTTKIRETTITYTAGDVTTVVEKQYNAAGSIVQTLTHTYSYNADGDVDDIDTVES